MKRTWIPCVGVGVALLFALVEQTVPLDAGYSVNGTTTAGYEIVWTHAVLERPMFDVGSAGWPTGTA